MLIFGLDDTANENQVYDLWQKNWNVWQLSSSSGFDKSNKARELLFNKTRDSLPLQQNITDTHTPPMWSFTLWPRNTTWNGTDYFRIYENYMDSTIVFRNTTYHLDKSIHLQRNTDSAGDPHSGTVFSLDDKNVTYPGDSLAQIGICLPSKDYVWGFSSLMLFTFCMLTVVVLLLLVTLHYDVYCNSMADQYKMRISPYRDVLDLAEELRAHYGEAEVASMAATS